MRTLAFHGASDDLFEFEEQGRRGDEAGCLTGGAAYLIASETDGGSLVAFGTYAPNPTPGASWVVGIAMTDEGIPLPAWPMRYVTGPANGFPNPQPYSPVLVIEVPDDATINRLGEP